MTKGAVVFSSLLVVIIHLNFASPACRGGHFACANSKRCIRLEYVCDGHLDCWDGEDERNCENCSSTAFWCDNGCKRKEYECDGHEWCDGGEDEKNCTVPEELFRCKDNTTRLQSVRCDGRYDCPHWDDESNCTECQGGALFCNGRCYAPSHRCDGVLICPDGEDEASCPTQASYANHPRCPRRGQFYCVYNDRCIDATAVCDGVNDCYDMSDERACSSCSETALMVDNRCVSNRARHEPLISPPNVGELEEHETYFSCGGLVFPSRLKCDGIRHCSNGYDEKFCDQNNQGINLKLILSTTGGIVLAVVGFGVVRWYFFGARYSVVPHQRGRL